MVQKGKFSAAAWLLLVNTLKNVDWGKFMVKDMSSRKNYLGVKKAILVDFYYQGVQRPPLPPLVVTDY